MSDWDSVVTNGHSRRNAPKLREALLRNRDTDSENDDVTDDYDLKFTYADTDTHEAEIAEIYAYSEQPEMKLNARAFEELLEPTRTWTTLTHAQKLNVVNTLVDRIESGKRTVRMTAARATLYLLQGCWMEMKTDADVARMTRVNCMLLYEHGVFQLTRNLLNYETEQSQALHVPLHITIAESSELRVILTILYIFVEVMRFERVRDDCEHAKLARSFTKELAFEDDGQLLALKLLNMVTAFCSGNAPHYPVKKIVMLLWKVLLITLGGSDHLRELKHKARLLHNLPPVTDDSVEVSKRMRSSSPPTNATDLIDTQNQKRTNRPLKRSLIKQNQLDDNEYEIDEQFDEKDDETTNGQAMTETLEKAEAEMTDERPKNNEQIAPQSLTTDTVMRDKSLPWTPKVRKKDVELFINNARQKFLGFTLDDDLETHIGLPDSIVQGLNILKKHLYESMSEVQIGKEMEINQCPMSTPEAACISEATEFLYKTILPWLPQYLIALLKVLLASAPMSRSRTDTINILSDVIPEEMPMSIHTSIELGIDIHRHKEIIVKAVSATLFLLLKHFKVNHVYQFEFLSQHLVFANCIPLILKYLNQNMLVYVSGKNSMPTMDFPACVLYESNSQHEENDLVNYHSWRNMFSCINMLRILNKLTKWKHTRIVMLVVFKSSPILKRTLKIRHPLTQLYVLKLLKMQVRYLGRQWRKSNMKTITAIYTMVRHRINDDWASGNDVDARPLDFQSEECSLRSHVDAYNSRRYYAYKDQDYTPRDYSLATALGQTLTLSPEFERNYEAWLRHEVFDNQIDWDGLFRTDNGGS